MRTARNDIFFPARWFASAIKGGRKMWTHWTRRAAWFPGAALATTVFGLLAASAATSGACKPTSIKYLASELGHQSSSTTFVSVPEAVVGFVQGGNVASCVIVRFSASTYAEGPARVIIRARLDNVTDAVPAEITFSGDDGTSANAHAYDFIFPNVTPGRHSVRIQYRSGNGNEVAVNEHTTVVQFAP
jgi:hypothetical protein